MKRDAFTASAAAHDHDTDAAIPAPAGVVRPPLGLVSPVEVDAPSSSRGVLPGVSGKPRDRRRGKARLPRSLAVAEVLDALLACGRLGGDPVAAHLWLADASGRLQLVHAVGPLAPASFGTSPGNASLQRTLAKRRIRVGPLRHVTTIETHATIWRFALPVTSGDDHGVAALDFVPARRPRPKRMRRAVLSLRPYLKGALALRALQAESDAQGDLIDALASLAALSDPDAIIAECLRQAIVIARADSGSVMLVEEGTRTMRIAASVGLSAELAASTEVLEGEGIAGWVLATGEPVAIEDLDGSPRTLKHGRRSAVSAPLSDSAGILGVVNVARGGAHSRLGRTELQSIRSMGRFAAAMLRRARFSIHEREGYTSTLASLAAAMEERDPAAGSSTQRVVKLAAELASDLGFDEAHLEALRSASLLHDIGMGAAAEAVVASERELSAAEWSLLRTHPLVAVDAVSQVPALADAVPIIRHHHEHWDGTGYVAGLAAEEIPIGARVLAVADAYVAMTSQRPHRKAMSQGQALAEISSKAGTQFDPVVVRVLAERLLSSGDSAL